MFVSIIVKSAGLGITLKVQHSNAYQLLSEHPILPVVTLDNAEDAPGVARALIEGGVFIMEVTLRTEAALDAIENVRRSVPEMIIGAGTIRSPDDIKQAFNAGAFFLVSPGCTPALIDAAGDFEIPYLPGAATPSEVMVLASAGYDVVKFYPAELSGGIAALQNFASVFPEVRFCPTGGIDKDNFNDYLHQSNVISVAGSWLTPKVAIESQNTSFITEICQAANRFIDHTNHSNS